MPVVVKSTRCQKAKAHKAVFYTAAASALLSSVSSTSLSSESDFDAAQPAAEAPKPVEPVQATLPELAAAPQVVQGVMPGMPSGLRYTGVYTLTESKWETLGGLIPQAVALAQPQAVAQAPQVAVAAPTTVTTQVIDPSIAENLINLATNPVQVTAAAPVATNVPADVPLQWVQQAAAMAPAAAPATAGGLTLDKLNKPQSFLLGQLDTMLGVDKTGVELELQARNVEKFGTVDLLVSKNPEEAQKVLMGKYLAGMLSQPAGDKSIELVKFVNELTTKPAQPQVTPEEALAELNRRNQVPDLDAEDFSFSSEEY